MKKRVMGFVAASTVALGGVAGGVSIATSSASAAESAHPAPAAPAAPADRAGRLRQELAGLVTDGTLTPAQADKVASTLGDRLPDPRGGGHAGPHHLDAAARVLGVSREDLRAALKGGKSLADVAAEKKVDKQLLIDELVKAARTDLDEQVKGGRLTQAQADERKANLSARITSQVDRKGLPDRGGRRGGPHRD